MTQDNKITFLLLVAAAIIGAIWGMYGTKIKDPIETQPILTVQTTLSGEYSADEFSQALEILKSKCPALFNRALDDIDNANAFSYETDHTYFKDAYGWEKLIELKISLKDRVNIIPASYKAAGHQLYFYLGSGRRTGVVTNKPLTQKICGWEVSKKGKNMFHAVPELQILKKAD